uniref:Small ribosomal subunit protein uS11c n=1 Tax=Seculamonas ecuadoriensis TaxID=221724 RepID=M4QMD3_SECEC|nr:ribosomal protein S11 [Seculamonas ecuadoriensis]AGH24518.1 ribosomal protein S11 [Seculamonas ecuadoriensis]
MKKRLHSNILVGHAYVNTTFNNTIITITDTQGNTVAWSSSGLAEFKGARRSTSYAAQAAAEDAGRKAVERGIRIVKVIIKGLGQGRNASIKGFITAGLKISLIADMTPVPHNGCRPPKKRRV